MYSMFCECKTPKKDEHGQCEICTKQIPITDEEAKNFYLNLMGEFDRIEDLLKGMCGMLMFIESQGLMKEYLQWEDGR